MPTDIISTGFQIGLVLLFIIVALYKYMQYKGIYLSDLFKFKNKSEEEQNRFEEQIKNFGTPSPNVIVEMSFKNNLNVSSKKVRECFISIKEKYAEIFEKSVLGHDIVVSYYDASKGVFKDRYKAIIHKMATSRLSEVQNSDAQKDMIFEELEQRLIRKTIEKEILIKIGTNMKDTLLKTIKPISKMENNIYKSIVEDIVIGCDNISNNFKVTKAISSMLVIKMSEEVSIYFSRKICAIYRNFLSSDLSKKISKDFELSNIVAKENIKSFVDKFKWELESYLEKELKTIILVVLNNILGGINKVPSGNKN